MDLLAPDWNGWSPKERGVLCFVIRDGQILLIEKKRGLGAGKANGPGGRIDPGETAYQAAIRETQEEIGVTPLNVRESGTLQFQFKDGYSLHCTVYRADDFDGQLISTPEADPFWASLDAIPYDRMWADDIHWMPFLLADEKFEGFFTFDEDRMLYSQVQALDPS